MAKRFRNIFSIMCALALLLTCTVSPGFAEDGDPQQPVTVTEQTNPPEGTETEPETDLEAVPEDQQPGETVDTEKTDETEADSTENSVAVLSAAEIASESMTIEEALHTELLPEQQKEGTTEQNNTETPVDNPTPDQKQTEVSNPPAQNTEESGKEEVKEDINTNPPQPATEPVKEAAPEPQAEPEQNPEPKNNQEPKQEPEPDTTPEEEPKPETEPVTTPEEESKPEAEPVTTPEEEPTPEAEPETNPEEEPTPEEEAQPEEETEPEEEIEILNPNGKDSLKGILIKAAPASFKATVDYNSTVVFTLTVQTEDSVKVQINETDVKLEKTENPDETSTDILYTFEKQLLLNQEYIVTLTTENEGYIPYGIKIREKLPEEENTEENPEESEEKPAEETPETVENTEEKGTEESKTDSGLESENTPQNEENAPDFPEDFQLHFEAYCDDGELNFGDVMHFVVTATGDEGIDYELVWQWSEDNENWNTVEGENGKQLDLLVTEENYLYYWRIKARLAEPQE